MKVGIHFAMNSTSWDEEKDELIPGGQGHRYYATVWKALRDMGVEYTVGRQPKPYQVNVYLSNRDRYNAPPGVDAEGVHTSHGLADKRYRRNEKTRTFSSIIVPGPAFTEKIIASGARNTVLRPDRQGRMSRQRRIVEAGYPKLDPLHLGEVDGSGFWKQSSGRVLYAPTHGGGSERWTEGNRSKPGARATTWWIRDQILDALTDAGFEVVLAPHPRHSEGNRATFAQYVDADVVVADGGSTIYEAWCLGKPVVLPHWAVSERNINRGNTMERDVYTQRIGYHADSVEDLVRQTERAAEKGISAREYDYSMRVIPEEYRGRGGKLWAEHLVYLMETAQYRYTPAKKSPGSGRSMTTDTSTRL